MNNNKRSGLDVHVLTECAILMALSVILSLIKLGQLPFGGSVTVASLLPLIVISYRRGPLLGLSCSVIFGVIKQLMGLNNLLRCPTSRFGRFSSSSSSII